MSQDTSGADTSRLRTPFKSHQEFLRACLHRGFNFLEIRVCEIDFDVLARQNFRTEDTKFVELLRRELKTRNGNVRDLERLHEVTSSASLTSLSAVTIEGALARLSTQQKLILWIIAFSRRRLHPY